MLLESRLDLLPEGYFVCNVKLDTCRLAVLFIFYCLECFIFVRVQWCRVVYRCLVRLGLCTGAWFGCFVLQYIFVPQM